MGIGLPKYVRPNSTPPERDRRRLCRGAGLKCDNGASGTGARKVLIPGHRTTELESPMRLFYAMKVGQGLTLLREKKYLRRRVHRSFLYEQHIYSCYLIFFLENIMDENTVEREPRFEVFEEEELSMF